MAIIPLAIINCTVVELLLQGFALVYVSYGEQHCITTPIILSIGNNVFSTTITSSSADDNQGNASPHSQLVNAFISAYGCNDTHVRHQ
jgi:hypothetical protein